MTSAGLAGTPQAAKAVRGAWCAAAMLFALGLLLHLGGLDAPIMAWMHQWTPPVAAQVVWSSLTVIGLGWAVLIIVLAADRGQALITAEAPWFVLACSLVAQVPKHVIDSPRPAASALAPLLHVIGSPNMGHTSFPSGHAMAVTAGMALLCLRLPPPLARRWGALLLAFAALVSLSRVMVGAHWPGDVLAGMGLGLATALLLATGRRADPERPARARWLARLRSPAGQYAVAAFELLAAFALVYERTGYPLGWPAQVLLVLLACTSAGARIHRQRRQRRCRAATRTRAPDAAA